MTWREAKKELKLLGQFKAAWYTPVEIASQVALARIAKLEAKVKELERFVELYV